MDNLFEYIDYRQYLKNFYLAKKEKNHYFSLRTISDLAGFKARDYLLRVMNGSRNLSEKGIRMLSEALKHSEKEADYFRNLVLFNQIEDAPSKNRYFKKIQEYKKQTKQSQLLESQYQYLSNWYNVVLRSLLPILNDCSNYRAIGRLLDPPLSESEVRKAIDLLLNLNIVNKDDTTGKFHVQTPTLSVDNHVQSLALMNMHKMFIELSRRSLDLHKSDDRDISGVTMCISNDGYQKIKAELKEFRNKLMTIAANDCNEDRIYHCNLHLFPVTKRGIKL